MTKFIGAFLGPMFAEQKVGAEILLGSLSADGDDFTTTPCSRCTRADLPPSFEGCIRRGSKLSY
jgi:hypothetical protein